MPSIYNYYEEQPGKDIPESTPLHPKINLRDTIPVPLDANGEEWKIGDVAYTNLFGRVMRVNYFMWNGEEWLITNNHFYPIASASDYYRHGDSFQALDEDKKLSQKDYAQKYLIDESDCVKHILKRYRKLLTREMEERGGDIL